MGAISSIGYRDYLAVKIDSQLIYHNPTLFPHIPVYYLQTQTPEQFIYFFGYGALPTQT